MTEQRRRLRGQRHCLDMGGGPYEVSRRQLGHGSVGVVKLAFHKWSGEMVALKIMVQRDIYTQRMEENVRNEIETLSKLDHPHICRLYEVIETPLEMFMAMELAEQDLFDYIVTRDRLEENEGRRFFQQLISGLDYCHKRGIVHRDIKPENLLVTKNGCLLITDFGLSAKMKEGELLYDSCGSYNYAAPEVLSGHGYEGPEVDVWSSGVVLYVMLCGSLPFDARTHRELYRKVRRGIYNLPHHMSREARDIIARMLLVDRKERCTLDTVKGHCFFQHNLPSYLQRYGIEKNEAKDESERRDVNPKRTDELKDQKFCICNKKISKPLDEEILLVAKRQRIDPSTIAKAIEMGPSLLVLPAHGNRRKLKIAAVSYTILLTKKRERELSAQVQKIWVSNRDLVPLGAPKVEAGAEAPGSPPSRPVPSRPAPTSKPRPLERATSWDDCFAVGHIARTNSGALLERLRKTLEEKGCTWERDGSGSFRIRCQCKSPEMLTNKVTSQGSIRENFGEHHPDPQLCESGESMPRSLSKNLLSILDARIRIRRDNSRVVLDFQKLVGDASTYLKLCSTLVLAASVP
mmetsp:Transcript_11386/g.28036  ORF Transcript_11386/g.28036 Transcript_11386/m.28036 type:complete len:576 (+) Transcript_11386:144-1871(+)|eukprot:CAMPEP_0114516998 /NCGR_PEP_ID=MMETSP0109-20121206/17648_1 /TAXON_ID=29199 /ORGANISM="Chlorarachnion reptans, Strain CCCM449" /LENGTH=575 /DNA_ID=CAMNT_0001697467 /DNA_START=101 /DNA_END=1828 /DNA_ORIENTATION=+